MPPVEQAPSSSCRPGESVFTLTSAAFPAPSQYVRPVDDPAVNYTGPGCAIDGVCLSFDTAASCALPLPDSDAVLVLDAVPRCYCNQLMMASWGWVSLILNGADSEFCGCVCVASRWSVVLSSRSYYHTARRDGSLCAVGLCHPR